MAKPDRETISRRIITHPVNVALLTAFTLATLLVPASGHAQTIYRQVTPDGRVVYTDTPSKTATTEKKIESLPAPMPSMPSTPLNPPGARMPDMRGPVTLPPLPQGNSEAGTGRTRADERRAAEEALKQAREAQERGVEPLPGERTGNANRTSRLNEIYWARQKELADAVAEAQERVNSLNQPR
jgi:hypothetical protein